MKKFLISLLLLNFACGKHDSPPPLDFADDDGDKKANYEEDGLSALLADVVPLEPIQGVLSIEIPGTRPKLIQFTNLRNFKERALELLTRNPILLEGEEHFTEWSRLLLPEKTAIGNLHESVRISLTFATRAIKAKSLRLVQDGMVQELGAWKPEMQFALKREQLEELLKGKANLIVTNRWMERSSAVVRKKTYRVFIFDGKKGQVYYVSRKLAFLKFLKGLRIPPPLSVEGKDFFDLTESVQPDTWWTRSLGEGDHIVARTSAEELKNAYRKGFTRSKAMIQKVDGQSPIPLYLQKAEAAMVYLKLKGSWTKREYEEKSEVVRHRMGGGREGLGLVWDCKYDYRSVRAERDHFFDRQTLLGVVSLSDAGGLSYDLTGHILDEKTDSKGQLSITLAIPIFSNVLKLELGRRISKKAPLVGLYRHRCDRGHKPLKAINAAPLSEEKRINVEVESWVEKL